MTEEPVGAIVEDLQRKLGRPLRILHIGNIANNAYNNAKIQRRYGIEADVLCHDYYHVMATPEWEDGGLTVAVDPALPDWWASNLQGFKRPDWYVQGPILLCLMYLQAHCEQDTRRATYLRAELERDYRERLRDHNPNAGANRQGPLIGRIRSRLTVERGDKLERFGTSLERNRSNLNGWRWKRSPGWARRALRVSARPNLRDLRFGLQLSRVRLRGHVSNLLAAGFWPVIHGWTEKGVVPLHGRILISGYNRARRTIGQSPLAVGQLSEVARQLADGQSRVRVKRVLRSLAGIAVNSAPAVLSQFAGHPLSSRSSIRPGMKAYDSSPASLIGLMGLSPHDSPDHISSLTNMAKSYKNIFAPVLGYYDVVQGYSVDGFIPLVSGAKVFASYEHGTLRDIPFEQTLLGLHCRVAYLNSPAVFVTNTDVLPSIARLGLEPSKVHYIPHAFDDEKLRRWRTDNGDLRPPPDEIVFFSPTRQHWTDENKSLTKGNDKMLRAAGRLRAEGYKFRLLLVSWGNDLPSSKALIDKAGLSSCVTWVPPMGKQDLWRTYCTSHAVLDQFILPALGGVGFETLALSRRLITHTDRATLRTFFGEAPPTLDAGTDDEVYASMLSVLRDPADQAGIGEASGHWIAQWHSAERTVAIQARVYRDLVAPAHSSVDGCATPTARLDDTAPGG
jgi:glycosyltransferase involved in cell wall biosynthesis